MSTQTIQILIATFPQVEPAEHALEQVHKARADQGAEVIDAAVVKRDASNKLHIHETAGVTGGRGATIGGILGGVLGLIAGPGGLVAGAAVGALVGGAAAKALDAGIPHRRLKEIGNALQPGNAALVVLTEQGYAPFLETIIGAGAEIVTESMNAQAAQELGHAHDVARKALNLGESLADGGLASASDSSPTS
ncbi:MAG: DUF1269 domain-containing protein [Chloroflexi bacterium]|nr:DUF1269 domain-containing protein [Chloroflexota bacterium]